MLMIRGEVNLEVCMVENGNLAEGKGMRIEGATFHGAEAERKVTICREMNTKHAAGYDTKVLGVVESPC
jgi:hypothetical protein